jgi:hypothetical protein
LLVNSKKLRNQMMSEFFYALLGKIL